MKVKLLKTGETVTVNDSYGARLIEQGKAVYADKESKSGPVKKEAAAKPAGER
ncbi:MAG: hypothetical protein PHI27_06550 [Eubacteriales bacterium]|nr:hypothetical protein [Eubacteriales bacterium]MDD4513733.1 hypothetical protein [Eubacteriales bacterium]